ncbi:hypothetical protein D3C75_1277520 [compost metagenome]
MLSFPANPARGGRLTVTRPARIKAPPRKAVEAGRIRPTSCTSSAAKGSSYSSSKTASSGDTACSSPLARISAIRNRAPAARVDAAI